ncbi:MAG: hypothetical protein ACXWX7_17400 [Candidatus Binatia bacterium]
MRMRQNTRLIVVSVTTLFFTGPAFDESRPTMTVDGTISLDEQRKALEYLLSPAQQKDPPRLERIYDFTCTKGLSATPRARLDTGLAGHFLLAPDRPQKYDPAQSTRLR